MLSHFKRSLSFDNREKLPARKIYVANFFTIIGVSCKATKIDLRCRVLIDIARRQPQSKETGFQSRVSYNISSKPNLMISPYAVQVSVEATLASSPTSSGLSSASATKRFLQKQEWKYLGWKLYLREVS